MPKRYKNKIKISSRLIAKLTSGLIIARRFCKTNFWFNLFSRISLCFFYVLVYNLLKDHRDLTHLKMAVRSRIAGVTSGSLHVGICMLCVSSCREFYLIRLGVRSTSSGSIFIKPNFFSISSPNVSSAIS